MRRNVWVLKVLCSSGCEPVIAFSVPNTNLCTVSSDRRVQLAVSIIVSSTTGLRSKSSVLPSTLVIDPAAGARRLTASRHFRLTLINTQPRVRIYDWAKIRPKVAARIESVWRYVAGSADSRYGLFSKPILRGSAWQRHACHVTASLHLRAVTLARIAPGRAPPRTSRLLLQMPRRGPPYRRLPWRSSQGHAC